MVHNKPKQFGEHSLTLHHQAWQGRRCTWPCDGLTDSIHFKWILKIGSPPNLKFCLSKSTIYLTRRLEKHYLFCLGLSFALGLFCCCWVCLLYFFTAMQVIFQMDGCLSLTLLIIPLNSQAKLSAALLPNWEQEDIQQHRAQVSTTQFSVLATLGLTWKTWGLSKTERRAARAANLSISGNIL